MWVLGGDYFACIILGYANFAIKSKLILDKLIISWWLKWLTHSS